MDVAVELRSPENDVLLIDGPKMQQALHDLELMDKEKPHWGFLSTLMMRKLGMCVTLDRQQLPKVPSTPPQPDKFELFDSKVHAADFSGIYCIS